MHKKILFLVTEDWYFLSHRLSLALHLKNKGYEVHVCCKNTGSKSKILLNKIYFHELPVKRKSLSIYFFFLEAYKTYKIVKKVKPNILHLISIRPIVVGFLISLFITKIKVCATFTGLGSFFISKNIFHILLKSIIKVFLLLAFRLNCSKLIVQNNDDANYISKFFLIDKKKIVLIKGSGVNINLFNYIKEPATNKNITLAYTGRILKDKGVHWLINSFLLAKKEMKNLSLVLAGPWDRSNPSAFSEKEFKGIKKINGIHYVGNVKDVKKIWKRAHIAMLLSKREGLPLGLIEAASVGRSIIATDVPGCREIVKNNINGITVPAGDVNKTKMAILKLAKNAKLRRKYGLQGRKLVRNELNESIIFLKYINIYEGLLNKQYEKKK